MIPAHRLEQINQRFQFLEASMSDGTGGATLQLWLKNILTLSRLLNKLWPIAKS